MDTLEERRAAYDRRARAWTFLVLGALVSWVAFGIAGVESSWSYLGWALVAAGVGAVCYGLYLFPRPRP